jgi:hypothetical protein
VNSRAYDVLLANVIVWVKLYKYNDTLTCTEGESGDVATRGRNNPLFIFYLFIVIAKVIAGF